ncbi:unnamed protein product, partial [Polarella glacialis]
ISNPVARHVACRVEANTPSVCQLAGFEDTYKELQYKILSLPEVGLLFETSPNFRTMGTDPKSAPDPIGPHQLPFQLTDPSKKVVYIPPFNQWPSEGSWASFTYIVVAPPDEGDNDGPVQPSEPGLAVLTNAYGGIAGSDFNLADGGSGWTISGNLETVGGSKSSGLQHQAFAWGGLNRYVYGVDEVQNLDFATGLDLAKWYFEASPAVFNREALASSYGGVIRFTVRSQYGDFRSLNDPLDWVTIECESCDSGHGARIVRFVDESLRWDGTEQTVELFLNTNGRWMYDPLNAALDFQYATECQIASVLINVSRIAILGDFTRGSQLGLRACVRTSTRVLLQQMSSQRVRSQECASRSQGFFLPGEGGFEHQRCLLQVSRQGQAEGSDGPAHFVLRSWGKTRAGRKGWPRQGSFGRASLEASRVASPWTVREPVSGGDGLGLDLDLGLGGRMSGGLPLPGSGSAASSLRGSPAAMLPPGSLRELKSPTSTVGVAEESLAAVECIRSLELFRGCDRELVNFLVQSGRTMPWCAESGEDITGSCLSSLPDAGLGMLILRRGEASVEVGGQSVLRISGGAVFCDMKLLGSLGSRPGRAAERKVLVRARTRCDGIAIAPNALLAARRSFPSEVARLVQVEQLQRHFELRVESAS